MSRLALTRDKIYKTVARQMHGVVPCWVCGEHVLPEAATLEHIQPRSEGGSSHQKSPALNNPSTATTAIPIRQLMKSAMSWGLCIPSSMSIRWLTSTIAGRGSRGRLMLRPNGS